MLRRAAAVLVFAKLGRETLSIEFRTLLSAARYYYIGQFTRGPPRRPLFFSDNHLHGPSCSLC